jgi:hypothetical protein
MPREDERINRDLAAAAVDAAQGQLAASADALLIEHLRALAQRSVDDAVARLPDRLREQAAGRRYVVAVSRAVNPAP